MDEQWKAELECTFYYELVERLGSIASAVEAARGARSGCEGRPVELVLKEEAHAVRGAAALLELAPLSEAAGSLEAAAAEVVSSQSAATPPADRPALLRALCEAPAAELRALLRAASAYAVQLSLWLDERKAAGVNLSRALELDSPADAARLRAISPRQFHAAVATRYEKLW